MSKETISFGIDAAKRAALDEVAEALERDRNTVINEALDAYLELHRAQVEHIQRSLAEAETGAEGSSHQEVFDRLRARIDQRLGAGRR